MPGAQLVHGSEAQIGMNLAVIPCTKWILRLNQPQNLVHEAGLPKLIYQTTILQSM